MKSYSLVLVAVMAILAGQGQSVKIVKPATCNGRLTGQMTFYEEPLLSRQKRQRQRPNGRQRRPRPPPPQTQPPQTQPPQTQPPQTQPPLTTTPGAPDVTTSGTACGSEIYRSADGTCNNANNPRWGSVDQAFRRMSSPEYTKVGAVYTPRRFAADGTELPNVRTISTIIHDPDDRPEVRPVMSMQWGQFLDHDITSTPVNPESKVCCVDGLVDSGEEHEDVKINGPCFPILIPTGDPHFTTLDSRCMENKRSYQVEVDGKPEQINLITSFIDGSNVYGSSDAQMDSLRSDAKGRGRLLEIDDSLPEGDIGSCYIDDGREDEDYCLLAGDSRVNVYPGLGALHTVFMRMHNVIADALAAEHPSWSDEGVFQQSRKIVGALLQKITYSEWLDSILGPEIMAQYRLNSGDYTYEADTDPTLYNVFSTAAFRFGHSMITDSLRIDDMTFESIDLFNNPRYVLHSLDSLLEGLLENPAQRVDRWYSTGMTNHMFERSPLKGFDIVALNIQRGRDHGLPSYNFWRTVCGLQPLANFDDMGGGGRRYNRVYSNVDHIDLYSGSLNERPERQRAVGETYACLIGRQFENLKYGDRFWYENTESPNAFTLDQIQEIEGQSLATVLCQTTGLTSVQRNAFMSQNDGNNPMISCNDVLPIDYSKF